MKLWNLSFFFFVFWDCEDTERPLRWAVVTKWIFRCGSRVYKESWGSTSEWWLKPYTLFTVSFLQNEKHQPLCLHVGFCHVIKELAITQMFGSRYTSWTALGVASWSALASFDAFFKDFLMWRGPRTLPPSEPVEALRCLLPRQQHKWCKHFCRPAALARTKKASCSSISVEKRWHSRCKFCTMGKKI